MYVCLEITLKHQNCQYFQCFKYATPRWAITMDSIWKRKKIIHTFS